MSSHVHIQHLQQCKKLITYTNKLTSPIIVDQTIYCVAENGDILSINQNGQTTVVFTILGQPSSLAFKEIQNAFLISDFAHQSIFSREENTNFQIHNLITEYNNHAFVGPNSIKIGPFTKNIYFTDSGAFQQTSIENNVGSVFVIFGQSKKLKSLSFRELAYPAGLQVDQQEKILLVCEMGQNRILKFILDETISGNYTVFHQFSGRFGPSAICAYNSKFYISLFQFKQLNRKGQIGVLNINGELTERLQLPTGSEISGICIYEQNRTKQQQIILVSEGNSIFRVLLKNNEEQSKLQESIVISKN